MVSAWIGAIRVKYNNLLNKCVTNLNVGLIDVMLSTMTRSTISYMFPSNGTPQFALLLQSHGFKKGKRLCYGVITFLWLRRCCRGLDRNVACPYFELYPLTKRHVPFYRKRPHNVPRMFLCSDRRPHWTQYPDRSVSFINAA